MPVTADSTLWTADTLCVTADGRVICIDAEVVEAAAALDLAEAVSVVSAISIETANALDALDAAIAALGYVLTGFDVAFTITPVAAPGYVITGFDVAFVVAPVTTTGYVLTGFDATFVVEPVAEAAVGGGIYYPPRQRPLPVVGTGYGILPQLEGEAHGVVGVVAKGAAQILVRAAAVGASGQAGNAAVTLNGLSAAGHGAVGARGAGMGMITKFSGTAIGQHDDDEAVVMAFLLAA